MCIRDRSGPSGGGHVGRGRDHGGRGSNQAETDGGSSTTVSSAASSAPASGPPDPSMPGRTVYIGGGSTSMGSAGADSSQTIGRARSVSGFAHASATTAATPSTYTEPWSRYTLDSMSAMPLSGAQPWRQVTVANDQGSPSAGIVPVNRTAQYLLADHSLPDTVGSMMARVILDSGSALTSISVGLLAQLSSLCDSAQLKLPFQNGPQTAHTDTREPVTVRHKTVPISVSVRTPWGAV